MEVNYSVTIEGFAERHYIKNFQKKYKSAWDVTLRSVIFELERISKLLETDKADLITSTEGILVVKVDFRVAGTKESAKGSGNRCIILVDEHKKSVSILLVYAKTDLSGSNETAKWMSLVKDNYPLLKKYL